MEGGEVEVVRLSTKDTDVLKAFLSLLPCIRILAFCNLPSVCTSDGNKVLM